MQIRPTLAAAIETLRPILVHGETIILEMSKCETYFATIASDILQYCILPMIRRQRYSQDTLQLYKQSFHDFMNKYGVDYRYDSQWHGSYFVSYAKLLNDKLIDPISPNSHKNSDGCNLVADDGARYLKYTNKNPHTLFTKFRERKFPSDMLIKEVLLKFIKSQYSQPRAYHKLPCGLIVICYEKRRADEQFRYALLDPITLNYQKIHVPISPHSYILIDDYGNIHTYDHDLNIYDYCDLTNNLVSCILKE